MPRGNQTGPAGNGPQTGRGLGRCSGYDAPGFTKGTPRNGAGFAQKNSPRRRSGRGRRQNAGCRTNIRRAVRPENPGPINRNQ
ncbi:MAG: DUF5320 domain-containing protein [Candidatus Marinimicrobia bacterium]|nr:DUF5320 domain-containing protein [Candidatus Neomarinimicrobiota bacterium]